MKHVAISLEPDVADAFIKAKPEMRNRARILVNFWLKDLFTGKESPQQELLDAIDVASRIAKRNGLTPKILEQILNEKE